MPIIRYFCRIGQIIVAKLRKTRVIIVNKDENSTT